MRQNRPCQDRAAKTAGLNRGGGQRRGVDEIIKSRRDRPDLTTQQGEAWAEAGSDQAAGQAAGTKRIAARGQAGLGFNSGLG